MDQEMINKSFLYAPIIELGEYLFNWGSVLKDEFLTTLFKTFKASYFTPLIQPSEPLAILIFCHS